MSFLKYYSSQKQKEIVRFYIADNNLKVVEEILKSGFNSNSDKWIFPLLTYCQTQEMIDLILKYDSDYNHILKSIVAALNHGYHNHKLVINSLLDRIKEEDLDELYNYAWNFRKACCKLIDPAKFKAEKESEDYKSKINTHRKYKFPDQVQVAVQ